MERRLTYLENEVAELRRSVDKNKALAGIRRGHESKLAGRSLPAREALASLRKELFPTAKPRRASKAKTR